MLARFPCRCSCTATGNGTCSHAHYGSNWTTNGSTRHGTGGSTDSCTHGHTRYVLTQIARSIWIIFGFKFIKDVDNRSRVCDFRDHH